MSIPWLNGKPGFSGKMFWTLEIPFKTGFTVLRKITAFYTEQMSYASEIKTQNFTLLYISILLHCVALTSGFLRCLCNVYPCSLIRHYFTTCFDLNGHLQVYRLLYFRILLLTVMWFSFYCYFWLCGYGRPAHSKTPAPTRTLKAATASKPNKIKNNHVEPT
jgi:hypothetical protein